MSEWKQIEVAPQDNATPLLLWSLDTYPRDTIGKWDDARGWVSADGKRDLPAVTWWQFADDGVAP